MNPRFMKNNHDRRVNSLERVSWLAFAIFFGLLISCGPVATAAPAATNAPATAAPATAAPATAAPATAAPVASPVECGYDVQAHNNDTWASIFGLNPLNALYPSIYPSNWTSLFCKGMVTTDSNGIAELRNKALGCSGLYIFRDSGVQIGSCDPQEQGSWDCVVGAASSASCDVGLTSPSADVILMGTWVSLITLDDGALSIVTVLEGKADVVPVTQLEYKYELKDDHSFVLEFATRVLNKNKTISLGPDESTYTASDAYLASLRQNAPATAAPATAAPATAAPATAAPASVVLPDPRIPLNPEQFKWLIRQLSPRDNRLYRYLEDVSKRANTDGQIFPAVLENTILLQGQGGFLEDNKKQQVVLIGVDWNAVQKNVAGALPTSLAFQLPGREGLLTDQTYDPINASNISDNLDNNSVTLLIPPGDDILRKVADSMVEAFKAMYITLYIMEVDPAEMQPKISTDAAAGIPGLWLEWR